MAAAADKTASKKACKYVLTPEQLARKKIREAAYHVAHREQRNARWRAWNKGRVRTAEYKKIQNAKARAYYAAHPEKRYARSEEQKRIAKIRVRKYQKLRAEELNRKAREKYAQNPEPAKAYAAKYQRDHPDKTRKFRVTRRARKLSATIGNTHIIDAWEKKWKARRTVICYWHKGEVLTRGCNTDHIIPISKGGAHSIENLCVSCENCNKRKSAKTLEVWNRQLAEPVLF